MSDENSFEDAAKGKALDAPALTPENIEEAIMDEQYYIFPGTALTVCALSLQNGLVVTGESMPDRPEYFDRILGRYIARGHAREKIWELECFRLRDRLSEEMRSTADRRTEQPIGAAYADGPVETSGYVQVLDGSKRR